MSQARANDLPHGLRLLFEAAGENAALAIALARGGTRLQVPKRAEDTVLQELVGIDAARAIVKHLAGESIYVPHQKRLLSAWLRAKGWSQERRANTLKVARRTIQYWDGGGAPARQRDLFDAS